THTYVRIFSLHDALPVSRSPLWPHRPVSGWCIVPDGRREVKPGTSRASVRGAFPPRATPLAHHRETQVQAPEREQEVVREHPEPRAHVQRGEEGGDAGNEVEPGKAVVEELGQPDLAGRQVLGRAGNVFRSTQVHLR